MPRKNALALILACCLSASPVAGKEHRLNLHPQWEFVADTVMGGVSAGEISDVTLDGREATRLAGEVSLDNNGGFIQMAFDLQNDDQTFDASGWAGIEIDVLGNGEEYEIRLRTDQLSRPWQSYRTAFIAAKVWTTIRLPFSDFTPNKTDVPFDPKRLRRIGILAYGREYQADVAVSAIRLYR
ncbi:CIA30 family protein [Roseovarius sp. CAU 1744]|uniref:CIA30 family protein n=1 Tax=Roseovarius sp. CAU 1744 TaxID=3140368 RepID=UPI00325A43E8